MKLYLEDDNGIRYEIQKAMGLQAGDVILFANICCRKSDICRMEYCLSSKFNRKVIILDGRFRDIAVIPPVLDAADKPAQTDSPD